MTVRAPLFLDGSNDLEEMSTAEVTSWVDYICYLYSTNPSVTLTVDTGSAGNLDAMSDTRLQAGAASTDNSILLQKMQQQSLVRLQYLMIEYIKQMLPYHRRQTQEKHGQYIKRILVVLFKR